MGTASDLRQLSFRNRLAPWTEGKFLNGHCLRFLYQETDSLRVNSLLNSVEQNSLLSVLENVETKRCPAGGACPERDQLLKLYISEESVLNKELINILQPTLIQAPDNYFHSYGINYLFLISFMFNIYFLYKFLRQKLPVKKTRSRKIGLLKWIIGTFLVACYGVSYYKFYKEAVASRLATSSKQDPCSDKEWKMTDLLTGLLTVSSEKTDCQRFIESHVGWAFLDVNPIDPLLEIAGKVLFGWISPLGHHLNTFYRKTVLGIPLLVQFVFLVVTISALLSTMKYWSVFFPTFFWSRTSRKQEKYSLEESTPIAKLSWKDPSPVRRATRSTARKPAKSRSRSRKEISTNY